MSFVSPLGALLAVLGLPIVAMYFLRIRRKKVRVPSLMLWHALHQSERLASPFQRFRKHLLLFLQLLLLATLVLALMRPYFRTQAAAFRSVVIVLDSSASMGATDESPSRIEVAKQRAQQILDSLGPSDEVMLLLAGPRTEVLEPFTRDEARVASTLGQIVASEAEGSLLQGLQLGLSLARSRPDVEVMVLSDGGREDLSTLVEVQAKIQYIRVGRSDENTGILALDLRRSPVRELDRELFVTVQHFGQAAVEASVEVYLDDALVGLRNERLSPDEPVSMVFELDGSRTGLLKAILSVPGDLLAADNTAYAVLSAVGSRRIGFVDGDRLTARVLASDPRVELVPLSSAGLKPQQLSTLDAVLFGGAVPPGLDGLSYAVLSRTGGPATLGEIKPMPEVLSWRRTHPLLRSVNLQGVKIARAARSPDLGGLSAIVDGDTGPLILAGEHRGGRVIQLLFDPLESDLPLRVAWPVFVLNSVGWLTEGSAGRSDARLLPAGTPYLQRLPESVTTAVVRGPAGPVRSSIANHTLRVMDTEQIGIYEVRAGERTISFATNLLSARESQIAPLPNLTFGETSEASAQAAVLGGRQEIWRPLLLLGLFLLMLEWLAWNRRKTA